MKLKATFLYLRLKYPSVLLLGYISFFADVASEMLYPITPIFLKTILGSSMINIGLIEGVAEGISSLLKTYSGFWSDKIKKRKPLIFAGYFLSALSRPLTGMAHSVGDVLGARSLDRVGKGLRSAPRDALITDLVQTKDRGLAFGWHRSLDTLGAVLGPLLALLMFNYFFDLRQIYIFALIPGLISVLIIFFVKESQHPKVLENKKFNFKISHLSAEYKYFLAGWSVFCLTNSSDVFLILKLKESGLSFSTIIMLYAFFNLVYSFFSPYLGNLSDKIGPKKILMAGLVLFILVYAGFAFSHQLYQFIFFYFIYGLYMASTEGISKAYVSNMVKSENSGTALGMLGTMTGLTQIFASIMTGYLWEHWGSVYALSYNCLGAIILLSIFFYRNILLFGKNTFN